MKTILLLLCLCCLPSCALRQFNYDERASLPGKADWKTLPADGADTTVKHGPEGPSFGP